ncbi:MAG: PilZ domain-containing protein [Candidatus Omnitrophica bacterium]|nr:PilZ domain-containing protein [Candidatus Omnitrophota bacterium]
MSENNNNKRKNKRLHCEVPVYGKANTRYDRVTTVDFCKDGMGLITEDEISVNEEIAIQIDLDEDDPVFVIGKVKWINPIADSQKYRIGMSFENVFRGSKTRLKKFFNGKNEE